MDNELTESEQALLVASAALALQDNNGGGSGRHGLIDDAEPMTADVTVKRS